MEKNTTATALTPTNENSRKNKKPRTRQTYTEADVQNLINTIASVPKRRKTYTATQLLERVHVAVYTGIREGRPVDDIFMAVAPILHVSRSAFNKILGGADKLAAAEAQAMRAIDTTATEIHDAPTTLHAEAPASITARSTSMPASPPTTSPTTFPASQS